jgi:subfamily B ATP-binding cassette protein MsbA
MKEFMQVLRRFVPPYKKYLVMSVVFNILSAVLNIFSFAALIPILGIIFKTDDTEGTTSHIVRLSNDERIEELARMLSGSTLTQAAIDNAKALLKL